MKKTKRFLSVMLACAMMVTLLCVPTAFAAESVNQSVTYNFDGNQDVPSIFSMVGAGGTVGIENDALKVTTNAGKTESFKIDISDWAGAASKKGILTYSFDYVPSADTMTRIMVGSNSTNTGHSLAAIKNTMLYGYDGSAEKEWPTLVGTTSPHKVSMAFDFSQETFTCSVDDKTISHPFSYYVDRIHEGNTYKFEDADKFVLYFRTYSASEYSYSIDNFKAEYTEPTVSTENVENATYNFDGNQDVPSIFSMVGAGGTVGIENNALKVTTNAGKTESFKIDISDWAGATSKKGILTYSFDYEPAADTKTNIMVGSNSTNTGHTLAAIKDTMLFGYDGASEKEWPNLVGTTSPHKVTMTFDFSQETFTCSVDDKTISHPFSYYVDRIHEGNTYKFEDADKFVLYFRTYSASEYSYSIDNFKAEYTEPIEKFTVNEFAFDNTAVTAGATLTVNYDIKNNFKTNEDVLVILGVYEGDRFSDCNLTTLKFTESNNAFKGSLNVTIPADANSAVLSVKAFLWENETLTPLIDCVQIASNVNPTVHIVGDSIYADYTDERYSHLVPDYGIGQALSTILTDVEINNKAIPGATTAAWDGDAKVNSVLNEIEKGDYVLISFCHNDQKTMTEADYKANLSKIANDVKAEGGIPVFITAIPRYQWDESGALKTTHITTDGKDAIQAMIDAGTENNVPVINLNALLRELYTAENTTTASYEKFYSKAEGESLDTTHLSETGAEYCANWLIQQFERMGFPFV